MSDAKLEKMLLRRAKLAADLEHERHFNSEAVSQLEADLFWQDEEIAHHRRILYHGPDREPS